MDELITQFASEARELVQQASDDLLFLERSPTGRERLESAFRAIHTLKGSVALFDFGPMQEVLHRAEDLLSQARAGKIPVDGELVDPLLAVIAWVDDSIDGIKLTQRLPEAQARQAPRLLRLLSADRTQPQVDTPDSDVVAPDPDWAAALRQRAVTSGDGEALVAIRYEPHPECFFSGDDPLATILRLPDIRHLAVFQREPAPSPESYDPFRCNLVIEALSAGPLGAVEAIFRLIPDQVKLAPLGPKSGGAGRAVTGEIAAARQDSTMRVNTARIDRLLEIAGELITAKNGLAPLADDARMSGDGALAKRIAMSHDEIERLVSSLYGAVTQARLIPLEQTFRRFPRLVRDTASKLGKSVDLIIEGETVEADREIVEDLYEPLLHLMRNGIDHGIEAEADRVRQSKPARGRIMLRARQRGDRIESELSDDGRGMDPQRVRETAIAQGLLSESRAAALSEREILQLAFASGVSTASAVTDVSGRGVGLDAVQRAVQALRGTLDLRSTAGQGTSFVLTLPVSFSMTQLMVVEVNGERYGIPMSDIVEIHKLDASAIQPIRAGRAFVLRNRTIPLMHLADLLRIKVPAPEHGEIKVLLMRAAGDLIGIAIDTIAERTQTLTRPLAGLLNGIPGIAGTTLTGDGKVLLVLDMEELLQ